MTTDGRALTYLADHLIWSAKNASGYAGLEQTAQYVAGELRALAKDQPTAAPAPPPAVPEDARVKRAARAAYNFWGEHEDNDAWDSLDCDDPADNELSAWFVAAARAVIEAYEGDDRG